MKVENLTTYYNTREGYIHALESLSFDLNKGEILGLIGESGCGKSTAGFSFMNMIRKPGEIMNGSVQLGGVDILSADSKTHRKLLWKEIAMIPQSAMNSLDPCYRIGDQIIEALTAHFPEMSWADKLKKTKSLMAEVGLDARLITAYPHKLSGGMKQRVVIAMALSCDPKILISDEATTGLDVLIEAQILAILQRLKKERDLGIVIISHDLHMITTVCDRIGVMYAGYLVEIGTTGDILENARHPYTRALFSSQIDANDFSKRVESIDGVVPIAISPENTCRFYSRCREKAECCSGPPVDLIAVSPTHAVACHMEGHQ